MIERTWNPAAILVNPQASPDLLAQLRARSGTWREIHSDHASVAFARVTALQSPGARLVP